MADMTNLSVRIRAEDYDKIDDDFRWQERASMTEFGRRAIAEYVERHYDYDMETMVEAYEHEKTDA